MGVDFGESSICVGFDSFDQEHFSAHNDDDGDGDSHKLNHIHYLMGSRPLLDGNFGDDMVFVDVNPNQPVTLGWQSHLLNDGHNRNQPRKWHFKLLRKIPSIQKLCPRSFWSLPQYWQQSRVAR
jgi:hypothetical protein